MKVRMELELDLATGVYDVRFHNLTRPGDTIDIATLASMVQRVLENVASHAPDSAAEIQGWPPADMN